MNLCMQSVKVKDSLGFSIIRLVCCLSSAIPFMTFWWIKMLTNKQPTNPSHFNQPPPSLFAELLFMFCNAKWFKLFCCLLCCWVSSSIHLSPNPPKYIREHSHSKANFKNIFIHKKHVFFLFLSWNPGNNSFFYSARVYWLNSFHVLAAKKFCIIYDGVSSWTILCTNQTQLCVHKTCIPKT